VVLSEQTTDELVALYAEAAAEDQLLRTQNKARGRHADRVHEIPIRVYSELRARGERDALLPLLDSENLGVRMTAGVHALDFAPALGEATLQAIDEAPEDSDIPSDDRVSASMILWKWRRGWLTYPDYSE
jgi:hypothetical protein